VQPPAHPLSLNNPSLNFSKDGLAFVQLQGDPSGPDYRCRPPHAGYSLPFKDAAVEARLDPNSKLCRNPLLPRLALGAKVSQIGTTIGVPHPALIQSRDIRKSL
jgi:hypothetical protein